MNRKIKIQMGGDAQAQAKRGGLKRRFSLIELLIVVAILGALMSLVLPSFNNVSEEGKEQIALHEMREIQAAFTRFAADMIFRQEGEGGAATNEYLLDIGRYGLWPLLVESHPVLTNGVSYREFDSNSGVGRRGPYLEEEAYVRIALPPGIAANGNFGQAADTGSTASVPALKDPWGGYYRVVVPAANSAGDGSALNEYRRLQKMVLVCTGADGILDTTPTSFFNPTDDPDYHKNKADDLMPPPGSDDIVIRLMPMAGY